MGMKSRNGDAPDADLADLIPRLARAGVLVVGDLMLDRYVYGAVSRISPEAPVPVLSVDREVALPGGAGNVLRNLTALGAACAFISVVGDDQAGSDLTGLIGGQPNVEPWLLVQGGRCTTIKTRFVASGQQLLRTDQEVTGAIHPKLADRLCRIAGDALVATSVTVLSDYRKGVLAGEVPARIIASAKAASRRVLVDAGADFARYAGADVVCVTARDLGVSAADSAAMEAAGRAAIAAHGFGAVVVHRGAEGIALINAAGCQLWPPALPHLAEHPGSRDTLVAALAASLAAGAAMPAACRVAGLALGVAASRPGIAVAENRDLLAMLTPHGRAQRKIMAPELAAEHTARWRELGLSTAFVAVAVDSDVAPGIVAAAGCERLVVGVEVADEAAGSDAVVALLARLAARVDVDAVCLYAPAARVGNLTALRPDVVSVAAGAELAALVRGWGGVLREV